MPSELEVALGANVVDVDRSHGFSALWQHGLRGDGVTVAVLDTGIARTERLVGRIKVERDFTGEGDAQETKSGHGASVARLVLRFAKNATIANLKVVPAHRRATREGVGKAIQDALEFCSSNERAVPIANISISLAPRGCPDDCATCAAVDRATEAGVLVVVAAGNRGPRPNSLTCPATAARALYVMATESRAGRAHWAKLRRWTRFRLAIDGTLARIMGTSYAAPKAAAAAALLRQACPSAKPDEIARALLDSSGGRVNLSVPNALRLLTGATSCPDDIAVKLDPERVAPLVDAWMHYSAAKAELEHVATYPRSELDRANWEANPIGRRIYLGDVDAYERGLIRDAAEFIEQWVLFELGDPDTAVREIREIDSYFGQRERPEELSRAARAVETAALAESST